MSNSWEQNRLYTQSRKMDKVTSDYILRQIIFSYWHYLTKEPGSLKLKINVVFDERSTVQNQAESYHSYLSRLGYRLGFVVHPPKKITENVVSIEVEKKVDEKKVGLKKFLDSIIEPRQFKFSVGCSITPVDENNEPIPKLSIVSNDPNYQSFFPKVHDATIFPIPKVPYRGSTTYETEKEKEILKKMLYEIMQNEGVRFSLFEETRDREMAFERLIPPGVEERQYWRIRDGDRWFKPDTSNPKVFDEMIRFEDVFSFYPKLSQIIDFDGKSYELQNRLVIEIDPRTASLEYASKIYDVLTNVVRRLGIPARRLHSGSRSPRVHIEIDAEDILRGIPYLKSNFPFIGSSAKKPIVGVKREYETVLGALKDVIYVATWNYSDFRPQITKNKFCVDYGYALVDFPSSVSIGTGSPKKIVRLDSKNRELLERIDERYRSWEHFTVNLCTPLFDNESAPKDSQEILKLCNALFSVKRLNELLPQFRRQIQEKVTTEHIATALMRVPTEQFKDLNRISEEKFREKYSYS